MRFIRPLGVPTETSSFLFIRLMFLPLKWEASLRNFHFLVALHWYHWGWWKDRLIWWEEASPLGADSVTKPVCQLHKTAIICTICVMMIMMIVNSSSSVCVHSLRTHWLTCLWEGREVWKRLQRRRGGCGILQTVTDTKRVKGLKRGHNISLVVRRLAERPQAPRELESSEVGTVLAWWMQSSPNGSCIEIEAWKLTHKSRIDGI